MSLTTAAPPSAPPASPPPERRLLTPAAILLGLLALAVRLPSRAPLWLDEAISVSIASLPLGEIPAALARDGAPPLYYFLLHFWIEVFGAGTVEVRALSTLLGLIALPVIFLLARRLAGPQVAWIALILAALIPFNVYYATETRMYALVVLEVALLGLLGLRAHERPSIPRLLALAGGILALALTHYWSFFLLASIGLLLVLRLCTLRPLHPRALLVAPELHLLGAFVLAGVMFLPWLPTFLFQSARTGAPWAEPPEPLRMLRVPVEWMASPHEAGLLALLGGLVLLSCWAAALLHRPRALPGLLGLVLLLTFLLGFAASHLTDAAYAPRYSAVALVPALLLAALGLARLPRLPHTPRLLLATLLAASMLPTSFQVPRDTQRTQAAEVAAVLTSAQPGDAVVYCPDQLAPAVHRLLNQSALTRRPGATLGPLPPSTSALPPPLEEIAYPERDTVARPDWVDYEARNRAADPRRFADELDREFEGRTIWLVGRAGYATYADDCEVLAARLRLTRTIDEVLAPDDFFFESAGVYELTPRRALSALP